MQLTNETIAAAGEIGCGFGLGCRIRKIGTANDSIDRRKVSVSMRGFDCCSANNEPEQH
jgi:hypothetical protein